MAAKEQEKSKRCEKMAGPANADRTIAAVAIARQPNQLEFCFQPKELG
jgi:hypothetical protein